MNKQKEIAPLKNMIPSIQPAFDDKCINICMSANNKYAHCLFVCIHSILKNSNKNDKYDIVILEKDLSDENKYLLKRYENEHVSIRFYSMSNVVDSVNANLFTYSYFSIEVYFRLFIPYIFIDYAKVLYLDCDAVCLSDIAEIYNQDLGNNMIGAVKDIIALESILYEDKCKNYKEELNTENVLDYVNSGVILFDIKKLIGGRIG